MGLRLYLVWCFISNSQGRAVWASLRPHAAQCKPHLTMGQIARGGDDPTPSEGGTTRVPQTSQSQGPGPSLPPNLQGDSNRSHRDSLQKPDSNPGPFDQGAIMITTRPKKNHKLPATRAKPLPKHRPTTTQAATRSRSLLSRSRVSRAVEAARRVGGRLTGRAPGGETRGTIQIPVLIK